MERPTLAPDGRALALIEGPDWDREQQATVGEWALVVVDPDTGPDTGGAVTLAR